MGGYDELAGERLSSIRNKTMLRYFNDLLNNFMGTWTVLERRKLLKLCETAKLKSGEKYCLAFHPSFTFRDLQDMGGVKLRELKDHTNSMMILTILMRMYQILVLITLAPSEQYLFLFLCLLPLILSRSATSWDRMMTTEGLVQMKKLLLVLKMKFKEIKPNCHWSSWSWYNCCR